MIEFHNVSKSFIINNEKVDALKNISFNIKQGEFVVLKGISGSGKSTIISLLCALSKPSQGEILVNNKQIAKLPDDFASSYRNNSVGLIFQKFNLFEDLSVYQNLVLPLYPKNLDQKTIEQKIDTYLEHFNLFDKKNMIAKKLSGGEQQRVAIIRALVGDAPIIIADEPTANLDQKLSLQFIDMVQSLKTLGKTIIIATHDPLFFELENIDQTIQLANGEIV